MISVKQLRKLQKYKIGSFAVWEDKHGSCSNKYLSKRTVRRNLHGRVVLLGLNRSGKKINKLYYPDNEKKYEFVNFHSKNHTGDKTLRKIIENKLHSLESAYMTDLYEKVESKSGKIIYNQKKYDKSIINLRNQLKIFGNKTRTIICFGNKVYNHIKKGYGIKNDEKVKRLKLKHTNIDFPGIGTIKVYRVWHYSNWGSNKCKVIEFKKQLKFINSELNK